MGSRSIRSTQDRRRAISAWDQKHTFVASYTLALPVGSVLNRSNRLTDDWSLSGTTRFSTGFPVTLYDNSDNSLLGTLGNGVNNYLLDTPQYLPGPLQINTNGRNGRPAFNTALFPEENLGQLGNAKRRNFYGPGINNFDLTLQKILRLTEAKSLEFRLEAFNAFNHAQFYGPASVDGQVEDPNFGQIVSAAAPRLVQLAKVQLLVLVLELLPELEIASSGTHHGDETRGCVIAPLECAVDNVLLHSSVRA